MSSDVQLTNMGDAPDQLYLQRREVTPSAANFRDISETDQKKERAIKIAMVVGAVILLIVTIVAVSEIAKLSPVVRFVDYSRTGAIRILYEYPALTAIVPGVFGGAGALGMALGAANGIDFERNRNGYSKDLSGDGAAENELFMLTSENLEGIHRSYHRRGGGVAPLVRNGLITEDDGRQLSGLLERCHEPMIKKASYENQGEAFKADLKAYPEKYPNYHKIMEDIAQLEGEWKALQKGIQEQYGIKE